MDYPNWKLTMELRDFEDIYVQTEMLYCFFNNKEKY